MADYPARMAAESMELRKKRRRRRHSNRLCPRCKRETLERKRLKWYLKPFRSLPALYPQSYACENCGKRMIFWSAGNKVRRPPVGENDVITPSRKSHRSQD
jgi:predicted RNA-binding Zn-ribbon protein involved in translation (DUF1610 family)